MNADEKWETWEAQFRKKGMAEDQIQAKKKAFLQQQGDGGGPSVPASGRGTAKPRTPRHLDSIEGFLVSASDLLWIGPIRT